MNTELVKSEPQAIAKPAQLSVSEMLQSVITAGVTKENVAVMEQLVGLYERMETRNAEKAFAQAFVELQAEMPKVKAVSTVPNKDGTIRYNFAPYEEIMNQVAPLLQKHGFTVSFSTRYTEATPVRLVKVCTLQHTEGHSKSYEFAVRVGGGPPGASESQSDGAASTYAKRFALCDALNITIDKDTDARAEGNISETITAEQAKELEKRVHDTGSDVKLFLAFAKAASFKEILASRYAALDSNLRKKERTY